MHPYYSFYSFTGCKDTKSFFEKKEKRRKSFFQKKKIGKKVSLKRKTA